MKQCAMRKSMSSLISRDERRGLHISRSSRSAFDALHIPPRFSRRWARWANAKRPGTSLKSVFFGCSSNCFIRLEVQSIADVLIVETFTQLRFLEERKSFGLIEVFEGKFSAQRKSNKKLLFLRRQIASWSGKQLGNCESKRNLAADCTQPHANLASSAIAIKETKKNVSLKRPSHRSHVIVLMITFRK